MKQLVAISHVIPGRLLMTLAALLLAPLTALHATGTTNQAQPVMERGPR